MRLHLLCSIVLASALCVPALALDADAKELFKKADAATKAVKSLSFKVESLMRVGEEETPRFKATVHLKAIDKRAHKFMLLVEGARGDERATWAFDGEKAISWESSTKKATVAEGEDADDVSGQGRSMFPIEFMHPTPFEDEVNAEDAKVEGTKTVAGVDCHVLWVKYGEGLESRWFFGKEDMLPRRVERLGPDRAMVMTISDLKAGADINESVFRPKAPEGYEVVKYEPPQRPKLIAAGSAAPNWTLSTPDGKSVSLAGLKGKVVVLDFWAVWCGPCKQAMPHVQEIHEKYKDKGVVVYGLSTWERDTNDPAKFMKDNNYTYGLLMKADDVAERYGVTGIPTFYVIDTEGNVVYSGSGFRAGDDAIEKAIEKALAKKS